MKKILKLLLSVDFVKKNNESDEVRDHRRLTGKYRVPAYSKCNSTVTQDESSFIPIVFHSFDNYDCCMFFKKLVDRKNDKVEINFMPKTNEK